MQLVVTSWSCVTWHLKDFKLFFFVFCCFLYKNNELLLLLSPLPSDASQCIFLTWYIFYATQELPQHSFVHFRQVITFLFICSVDHSTSQQESLQTAKQNGGKSYILLPQTSKSVTEDHDYCTTALLPLVCGKVSSYTNTYFSIQMKIKKKNKQNKNNGDLYLFVSQSRLFLQWEDLRGKRWWTESEVIR